MKFDKSDWKIAVAIMLIAIAGISCYWLGTIQNPQVSGTADCLTTTDLNRQDIGASVVLSRFCEGMGLQSSIYWQKDEQGQVYGLPICQEAI